MGKHPLQVKAFLKLRKNDPQAELYFHYEGKEVI
jgi:hypothetical protein